MEDSGRNLVVEHWRLKPGALGLIPSDHWLFTFLCFHLITLTLYPRRACAEINLIATRQDIKKWRFCIMTIDSVISCKLAEFTG